ncbi:MAG: glutathione S-transferase family protein [Gammaproteobacteria bacterium]|nr:glutathione S-transferase family protein [Gammaproteobacteria bacterium]
MKLYGAIASPYVARVVMLARLKGIDLPLERALGGGLRSEEYRAFNPISKMPSLEVDGRCIAESAVICEYLEEVYPDPPLLPADPILRAHSRMVSRINDLYIAPHNNGLVQQQHADPRDQQLIDNAAVEFEKGFRYVAHFMGPGPFAAGDRPSIGDCALTPFIIMLKQTVFPFFEEIPDPTDGAGRLATWWQAIQADPGCREAADEIDLALTEFLKYLMERIRQRQAGK